MISLCHVCSKFMATESIDIVTALTFYIGFHSYKCTCQEKGGVNFHSSLSNTVHARFSMMSHSYIHYANASLLSYNVACNFHISSKSSISVTIAWVLCGPRILQAHMHHFIFTYTGSVLHSIFALAHTSITQGYTSLDDIILMLIRSITLHTTTNYH